MLTSWLLLACGPGDDTAVPVQAADVDGDGFSADEDCDDLDPYASPAATETCNGRDDDCDGETDEGEPPDAPTWYLDADGDGYGLDEVVACEAPEGSSWLAGDCDDGDPDVSPGADELCGGGDEDCDGTVDEAGAADATTWYVDSDGDGHGDAAASWRQCERPEGTSDDDDDCDDGEATVYVDAPEICNDGLDNDCDGLPSPCLEGELSVSEADAWYSGSSNEEQLGSALDGGGDLDGDGVPEWVIGAPGNDFGAGAVTIFSGADELGQLFESDALAVLTATSGRVGSGVGFAGDRDDDGLDDLWVGAPSGEGGYARVYLVSAGEALDEQALEGIADRISGPGDVGFGKVVAAADADGDDEPDLLFGTPDGDVSAWYVRGPVTGQHSVADVGVSLSGRDNEALGTAVVFVDIDGDGMDELAMGAPNAARVRVFDRPDAAMVADDAWLTVVGQEGSELGQALLRLDLDLDGYDELLVGAPGSDGRRGTVHVLAGPVEESSLDDTLAVLAGSESYDHAGYALAHAGDIDSDGRADLLVGGPRIDHGGGGSTWLVTEQVEGALDLANATARLRGEDERGNAGWAVAGAGDVDRDSYDDVLVAGPSVDDGEDVDAGTVWLFLSAGTSRW